jgi:phosphoribosylglycinamide formyltransferase 2
LEENTEVRIFGKPTTRPYRRMAVTLAFGEESVQELVEKAKKNAAKIQVK